MGEIRRGRHWILAAADAMVSADGGGELARQTNGLAQVGGMSIVGRVGVVHAEHSRGRLQDAHGIRVLGHQAEGVEQGSGDLTGSDQLGGDPVELGGLGELAVPQEVAHLLERGLTGEIVDAVTAVGEARVGAVEIAELGFGGHDTFEPPDELRSFGHGKSSRPRVYSSLVYGSLRRLRWPLRPYTGPSIVASAMRRARGWFLVGRAVAAGRVSGRLRFRPKGLAVAIRAATRRRAGLEARPAQAHPLQLTSEGRPVAAVRTSLTFLFPAKALADSLLVAAHRGSQGHPAS